ERLARREREALRRRDADEQRVDESRTVRHGDAVDRVERHARAAERLAHRPRVVLHVRAARDLGHDAAEPAVQLRLRRDDRRKLLAPVADDGRGGFVAGGVDAEDEHGAASSPQGRWNDSKGVKDTAETRRTQRGAEEDKTSRGSKDQPQVIAVLRGPPRSLRLRGVVYAFRAVALSSRAAT